MYFAGGDDLPFQRHVGQHDHIGVFSPLNLHLGVGVLGVGGKAVAGIDQGFGTFFQHLLGNAQRFQQYNFHNEASYITV